ncbi:hypothetical protein D3C72_2136990 [compost metagenome]
MRVRIEAPLQLRIGIATADVVRVDQRGGKGLEDTVGHTGHLSNRLGAFQAKIMVVMNDRRSCCEARAAFPDRCFRRLQRLPGA